MDRQLELELPPGLEQELEPFLVPALDMDSGRLAQDYRLIDGQNIPSRMKAAAASSPLAVDVSLARRLVRPDKMAFLRASARAFATSLISYKS